MLNAQQVWISIYCGSFYKNILQYHQLRSPHSFRLCCPIFMAKHKIQNNFILQNTGLQYLIHFFLLIIFFTFASKSSLHRTILKPIDEKKGHKSKRINFTQNSHKAVRAFMFLLFFYCFSTDFPNQQYGNFYRR